MKSYFDKHLFKPIRIETASDATVNMIIVIPCFSEPALLSTLTSLVHCKFPRGNVEVIIVLNAPKNASHEARIQNEKTFREITEWKKEAKPAFKLFTLRDEDLPPKHAGVGLARKIGMDEAAWRFEASGRKNGIILCLDADCTVAPNYLQAVETYFDEHPQIKAASLYFEHPLNTDKVLREGIIKYELHLRYYRQALKYANYPNHYHTIGSSMGVLSPVYQQAGGMNRRKAGEDFYFLHKIMPLGNFGEINSTTVYPAGRISERVPFGTGRAMRQWADNPSEYFTYSIRIFDDFKTFIGTASSFYNSENAKRTLARLPASIRSFLLANNFLELLDEFKTHTSSAETFIQRFYRWLDGFMVLKLTHHLRDNFYPNIPISLAANELVKRLGGKTTPDETDLLTEFRAIDRAS